MLDVKFIERKLELIKRDLGSDYSIYKVLRLYFEVYREK